MAKKVIVIDYGLGNLFSVERALRYVGADVEITGEAAKIRNADSLILPGVGAFGDGMAALKKRDLIRPLMLFMENERPFLGICLGMQLLMSESEEFGSHRGLDIVSGKVIRLKEGTHKIKIPHVGWNRLAPPRHASPIEEPADYRNSCWKSLLLEDVRATTSVYFVHSYKVVPDDPNHILAETEYGENLFCSVLQKNYIWACQFHPERSGEAGLGILRQFLNR
jgi:glutamine amidotransferase